MISAARLRILHVTTPAPFGGLERIVSALAEGHAGRGHEVHVAAVVSDAHELPAAWAEGFARADVQLHPLVLSPRAYRQERRGVFELARAIGATIAHTHGYRADVIAGRAAQRAGARLVSTVHGFTREGRRVRLYEALQRYTLRRFDAVVTVSRPLHEELERSGVPTRRLHLVPNGWDGGSPLLPRPEARRQLGIAPEAFVAGWVGRLSAEKGCDVALEALAATAREVRLSVVGDGPLRPELERAARRMGIADRVCWHGAIAGAGRYFHAFDSLVLSSRTEGTPIVLFEAMAARTPIVASRVGGVPDIVRDDEAVLVPAENPGALAAAIESVRQRPDAARERAERATERLAMHFGGEQWLTAYEHLYHNLAGRLGIE